MKTTTTVILTAALSLMLGACGAPPANNTNTNTNTNTAKPTAAAPTTDALMALDKQANEAYAKGDSSFFEGFLSDKFTMMGDKGGHLNKADTVKMIGTVKCDVKTMDLTEPQMAKIDADTYVLSYKAAWDGTCTDHGKSMKIPSPVRSASVYVRNGDKWMGAWHGETPIVGEKAAPAPAAKKDEAVKDEPKKPEAKSTDVKKPEAKADVKATDSAADAPVAAAKSVAKTADAKPDADAAKPTADPNTDALTKIHTAGWAAYKERDAKKLEELTASNLSFVSPMGMWFGDKASTIKEWTAAKCDIKSTSVADGFASALSPTVEILYTKGTAVGTCDGPDGKPMKLGSLWGSAVYVKEGNDWKLAFLFESPA